MHCELVVPGLPASPSLETLVARGRRMQAPARRVERWLQQEFAVEGRLPAGALSLLGAGGTPGNAFWTRADPVHLRAARERVLIVPAAALAVSREETEALCLGINRHFAGTLEFRALDAGRWCARLEREIDFGDEPTLDMAGREATTRPGDALLTEIQMLLHAHPVNEAREARGAPPVNSVWFWGAGRLPAAARCRWQSVTSDDPLALGLARLAGASPRAPARSAAAWLAQAPEEGRHLIVLDALENAEQDWFAPLARALRAGHIGMLTVHLLDAGLSSETVRGDLRRFWRRPKALAAYQ